MNDLKNEEFSRTTLAFTMLIILSVLAMVANAKAAKLDKGEVSGAVTNTDILFPPTSSDTESVCIEIWKGNDGVIKHGEHLRVHKLKDTLHIAPDGKATTWADVCLDDAPRAWEKFQPSVQVWKKGQKEKFQKDTLNRYVTEFADLTKAQKDALADSKVKKLPLGNYRLRKETK